MKLGFIVNFFDFRVDVRYLITSLLERNHQVVIYYNYTEREKILQHPIEGVEYRLIQETQRTFRNRIWEYLFLFFKKIPKSRNNYFLMELFKITNSPLRKRISISDAALWVQKLGINFIHYDTLLKNLKPARKTDFSDIDKLFAFTEFPCDYLAARLVQDNIPFQVYVYSWDHPCKHTRFSKKVKYFAWSDAIQNDLVELQGLSKDKISVLGSTQFSSIYDYLYENIAPKEKKYDFEYIYYCCAIAIKSLVPDEVAIIQEIAQLLAAKHSEIKLVIRPYPLLNAQNLYSSLERYENIVFDKEFLEKKGANPSALIREKYDTISSSLAVLHTGSTIGLEAAFLGKPSLVVDFGYTSKKALSVYNFVHQYQNVKYIIDKGAAIDSINHLDLLVSQRFSHISPTAITKDFVLMPMENIMDKFIQDSINIR